MARLYSCTVYDGLYLALVQVEQCEMVTGDRRLFNAVHSHLSWVGWIGDYVIAEEDEARETRPGK
jgi:hypothetical protein